MKEYKFEVQSIHPPEYKASFYGLFEKERSRGNLHFKRIIKEIAPPPELIRDFVLVTASSLTIIKILYDFHKEIKSKNKKAKVFITINGKTLDLEAHNIDELKLKMSEESN